MNRIVTLFMLNLGDFLMNNNVDALVKWQDNGKHDGEVTIKFKKVDEEEHPISEGLKKLKVKLDEAVSKII